MFFQWVGRKPRVSHSIYIVAGEVSGDIHGAHLVQSMLDHTPELSFSGAGGPAMQEVGGEAINDWLEDAAVMGVWEVLKHYQWFKKRFYEMLDQLVELEPDVLILIDYPGFNLRFAAAVRKELPHIKIVYYISPQVWAWNKGRLPKMAATLDLMLCIFPFEKPIFEQAGLKTEFVGHPLVDELEEKKEDVVREDSLIGLFPGSRESEVDRLFPLMVETARRMYSNHPKWRYEAAAASPKLEKQMRGLIEAGKLPDPSVITLNTGNSHSLMQRATCGVVASGTATLEAAALGLPYCLVYKIAWPTWIVAKLLVKIKLIGIVNILAGEEVVEELVQCDADPGRVESALEQMMLDVEGREALQARLLEVTSKLGEPGAHVRAAEEITKLLK
jgi:lipid-A-disaccharide synthase